MTVILWIALRLLLGAVDLMVDNTTSFQTFVKILIQQEGKQLICTLNDLAAGISPVQTVNIAPYSYENIDTGTMLHAKDAVIWGPSSFLLKASDTVCVVICLSFFTAIKANNILFDSGPSKNLHLLPILKIHAFLGPAHYRGLPFFFLFPVHDTTTATAGFEKVNGKIS